MSGQRAKVFAEGVAVGSLISLAFLLTDFYAFYLLQSSWGLSRYDAVTGFVVFAVFGAILMIVEGFNYSQKQRIEVLQDLIVTQQKSVVEYPQRSLLSSALIVAGVLLLLLMIFVVPENLLPILQGQS